MKRIHLFEFEDFEWFPVWLRNQMTKYIAGLHGIVGTTEALSPVISELLERTGRERVVDLCSGAGGPMVDVVETLREQPEHADLQLTLTDLYPNIDAAERLEGEHAGVVRYVRESVDATAIGDEGDGALRTIVCALHHMKPDVARRILADAVEHDAPICAFELSDNSMPPTALWWISLLPTFISTFFFTPKAKPLTFGQLFFTYVIPVLPLLIAWDGSVSNTRTYTEEDLGELTSGLDDGYSWEVRRVENKSPNPMLLLLGQPT